VNPAHTGGVGEKGGGGKKRGKRILTKGGVADRIMFRAPRSARDWCEKGGDPEERGDAGWTLKIRQYMKKLERPLKDKTQSFVEGRMGIRPAQRCAKAANAAEMNA